MKLEGSLEVSINEVAEGSQESNMSINILILND